MIIFKKPNKDTYSVRHVCDNRPEKEHLKEVQKIDPNAFIVNKLPKDRNFRDAWEPK